MIPLCPFCSLAMDPRSGPMDAYYKIYVCGACRAELKQVVASVPGDPTTSPGTPSHEGPNQACADCFASELECHNCGDPVCDKHVRTVEKYSRVFTDGLSEELIEQYGNRVYCPACIQLVFSRFGHRSSAHSGTGGRRVFNLPVILGLLLITLLMIFGVQQCGAADPLRNEVKSIEDSPLAER